MNKDLESNLIQNENVSSPQSSKSKCARGPLLNVKNLSVTLTKNTLTFSFEAKAKGTNVSVSSIAKRTDCPYDSFEINGLNDSTTKWNNFSPLTCPAPPNLKVGGKIYVYEPNNVVHPDNEVDNDTVTPRGTEVAVQEG